MPYFFSTSAATSTAKLARDADQVGRDEHEPLAGRIFEAHSLRVEIVNLPFGRLGAGTRTRPSTSASAGVMIFVATPALNAGSRRPRRTVLKRHGNTIGAMPRRISATRMQTSIHHLSPPSLPP